jgi:hypothetical protein
LGDVVKWNEFELCRCVDRSIYMHSFKEVCSFSSIKVMLAMPSLNASLACRSSAVAKAVILFLCNVVEFDEESLLHTRLSDLRLRPYVAVSICKILSRYVHENKAVA